LPREFGCKLSHADCEQERRPESQDGGYEGGDYRPQKHDMEEGAGGTEGVGGGAREAAPHPANYVQMREQQQSEAQAQRASRPGEGAADGVDGVEDRKRAAPDTEAGGEPPEAPGRNGARGQGRASSIAASAGSTSTRASAIAPVRTV